MITGPNQYSREMAQTQAIIADVRCLLAELKFELVLQRLRRKANFNPYQPRVPAGNPDGGQWTIVGGRITDRRVISDATPDDAWKPGTRYAQNVPRGPRPPGAIRINDRWVQPEPGQAARLVVAEARSDRALRRVRELDPGWTPRPGLYDSVEGLIENHESVARHADARAVELLQRGAGGFDGANIRDKVLRYLLDPDHSQNQGKAKWFQEALGFDKTNWQELSAQIRFDPTTAVLKERGVYGYNYEQIIPIVGANGRTVDVRFEFLEHRTGLVTLVTGIPTKK
jgi:hypothetical protein